MTEIRKNTQVRLKSFLGTLTSKKKVFDGENYWKLIGEKGKVIDDVEFNGGRVLVLFENSLDDLKVINHNPIKNTLWIKKSDLEIEVEISSILELENWMTENGIKNTFTPKNRFETDEGLGLEINNGLFVWYHFERGQRNDIKYFRNEQEAAEYIYEYLKTENEIL